MVEIGTLDILCKVHRVVYEVTKYTKDTRSTQRRRGPCLPAGRFVSDVVSLVTSQAPKVRTIVKRIPPEALGQCLFIRERGIKTTNFQKAAGIFFTTWLNPSEEVWMVILFTFTPNILLPFRTYTETGLSPDQASSPRS